MNPIRPSLFGLSIRTWGVALLLAGLTVHADIPREYQVKAAFLYNFVKFVQWPDRRPLEGPIVIGLLDENPFGEELAKIVAGRRSNGRSFSVRVVTNLQEASRVDLLFVSADTDGHFARLVPDLRATAVLTVGETAQFQRVGGIIRFVVEGERVRFAIDADSGRNAGLRLSAQLLKLAVASAAVAP